MSIEGPSLSIEELHIQQASSIPFTTESWEASWPGGLFIIPLMTKVLGTWLLSACQYCLVRIAWLCIVQHCLHYNMDFGKNNILFLENNETHLVPSQTTNAKDIHHTRVAGHRLAIICCPIISKENSMLMKTGNLPSWRRQGTYQAWELDFKMFCLF